MQVQHIIEKVARLEYLTGNKITRMADFSNEVVDKLAKFDNVLDIKRAQQLYRNQKEQSLLDLGKQAASTPKLTPEQKEFQQYTRTQKEEGKLQETERQKAADREPGKYQPVRSLPGEKLTVDVSKEKDSDKKTYNINEYVHGRQKHFQAILNNYIKAVEKQNVWLTAQHGAEIKKAIEENYKAKVDEITPKYIRDQKDLKVQLANNKITKEEYAAQLQDINETNMAQMAQIKKIITKKVWQAKRKEVGKYKEDAFRKAAEKIWKYAANYVVKMLQNQGPDAKQAVYLYLWELILGLTESYLDPKEIGSKPSTIEVVFENPRGMTDELKIQYQDANKIASGFVSFIKQKIQGQKLNIAKLIKRTTQREPGRLDAPVGEDSKTSLKEQVPSGAKDLSESHVLQLSPNVLSKAVNPMIKILKDIHTKYTGVLNMQNLAKTSFSLDDMEVKEQPLRIAWDIEVNPKANQGDVPSKLVGLLKPIITFGGKKSVPIHLAPYKGKRLNSLISALSSAVGEEEANKYLKQGLMSGRVTFNEKRTPEIYNVLAKEFGLEDPKTKKAILGANQFSANSPYPVEKLAMALLLGLAKADEQTKTVTYLDGTQQSKKVPVKITLEDAVLKDFNGVMEMLKDVSDASKLDLKNKEHRKLLESTINTFKTTLFPYLVLGKEEKAKDQLSRAEAARIAHDYYYWDYPIPFTKEAYAARMKVIESTITTLKKAISDFGKGMSKRIDDVKDTFNFKANKKVHMQKLASLSQKLPKKIAEKLMNIYEQCNKLLSNS